MFVQEVNNAEETGEQSQEKCALNYLQAILLSTAWNEILAGKEKKPRNTGGTDPRVNSEKEIWDIEAGL